MGTPGKPRYTRIDANPANRVRLEILSSLHYTRTDANRTDYVRTGIPNGLRYTQNAANKTTSIRNHRRRGKQQA